jgi:quercetin dioxygenase-like cupin family protein
MKITNLFQEKRLPLQPGYTAQLFSSDNTTLSLVTIDAQAPSPEHAHPHEQITVVLKGELEMVIDGERCVLKEGDAVLIPGNAPHSAQSLTECLILDIFNPVREDLMAKFEKLG